MRSVIHIPSEERERVEGGKRERRLRKKEKSENIRHVV